MDSRPTAPVQRPGATDTGGRFSADPVRPGSRGADSYHPNAPSGRIGNGPSRGSVNVPQTSDSANRFAPTTPSTPNRPGRVENTPGAPGGRWTGPSTGGANATPRPGSIGDIGGGTRAPIERPGSVSGGVAAWRAPARNRGGTVSGPNGNAQRPGANDANPPGASGRKPTYITPTLKSRPPSVNRERWLDPGRHFGGRRWDIVPLGYYDPWASYRSSSPWFVNVRFYYPYYYIGPYYSGFYYSPYYMYGPWFPTYVYPERVVYIQQRIYLRDWVGDDYYDIYGTTQASLRDTMDDIKSAWLYGDGGRLLTHINASVPVRIYQRGVYKYSLEPEDFRDITKDALNRVDTTGFEWTKIDQSRADEVVLTARHTFRDPDGKRNVIRLTYTLEKARGAWWITETGTQNWDGDI